MARVKRAVNAQKKRRTVLETASGYRGQRSRLYRKAKEQMLHSMQYAYRDRRDRKGDFRQLWITRINAAARANGHDLQPADPGPQLAGVEVDRKILADLAVNDEKAFAGIVEVAKQAVADTARRPGRLTARPATQALMRPGVAPFTHGRPGSLLPGGCTAAATATPTGRFLAEGPQAVREALPARRGRAVRYRRRRSTRHGDVVPRRPATPGLAGHRRRRSPR